MRRSKISATKLEIVQVATKMFLEKGYSNVTAKGICDVLDLSTGNLTYYFPTKEHMLAVVTEMLCDFQWSMMERETDEGLSSLLAQCLEIAAMAVICEESEVGRDLYLSAYTHPMSLEIIRRNDAEKARKVFGEYCANWSDINYKEAETLVSGIEYATMMTTSGSAPLDVRIAGALGGVMMIYNVPEDVRRKKIDKVLSMDYRAFGRRILDDFVAYVGRITEGELESFLKSKSLT